MSSAASKMSLFTVSQYFSTRNGNTSECFVQTRGASRGESAMKIDGRRGRTASAEELSDPEEDTAPSVHWAEDMDGVAEDFDLKDQIKRAKEMGYTDEAVLNALRSNASSADGRQPYKRFSDMNCMLDLLNKSSNSSSSEETRKEPPSHSSSADSSPSCDRSSISGRGSSTLSLDQRPAPMKLSEYRDQGSRTNRSFDASRSASVSRSSSFHIDTRPTSSRKGSAVPNNDIHRLMTALDKEHERNRSNQMEQIELLMQKVDEMKRDHAELRQKLDEKILSELQLEKQLKDQKELEEYRRSELIDRTERLQGELSSACEERDQMRTEMQGHIHRETELQAVIEDRDKTIQDMVEVMQNAGSISRRSSVFRPHCTICLERWPNIVFSKCMHLACCEECFVMASANTTAPMKTCPTCREPITGSLKVYL